MAHYKRHLFICVNQREPGEACCGNFDARKLRKQAKALSKELGIAGEDGVRVNSAGCMGRCEEGPIAVVYPDGTWYTYVDWEDLEEIVREHLQNGRPVERLKI
ncbi:MAG TPA: (2Fe-2S) ferredoxin domain-containing protein [Chromatiales bacterium]|nr:(2Fe-2S) ferredoxin domain-containing protein [Thiotrichales bacterium]HIP67844.1 (2Fe-2S) ferredoxin domain-containing protein [Chromatiales bacterium]